MHLVEGGGETLTPVVPHTIARSIAIGNPADGRFAASAIRRSGGWAAGVSRGSARRRDPSCSPRRTGVFTETAGGVTRRRGARTRRVRAGSGRKTSVVLCITGNGLKTVEALQGALPETPIIAPRIRDLEAAYGRDL